jgi:hypothetical protein
MVIVGYEASQYVSNTKSLSWLEAAHINSTAAVNGQGE